jgi:hypothetical protein
MMKNTAVVPVHLPSVSFAAKPLTFCILVAKPHEQSFMAENNSF